jgi:pilus assembly protein FimV
MRIKTALVGIVLTGAALASVAMSLGRARGAAWIGQPLSLVVPVQLDAGQTASTLCAEADVFHAESKLESSKVSIAVEPTAQADTVNLRITSSTLIDEPVVTVYVRAGCSQKTTRRYVLLADYPTDTAPVVAPASAPTPVETAPAKLTVVAPEASTPKTTDITTAAVAAPATKPVAERPRKPAPAPAKAATPKVVAHPEKAETPPAIKTNEAPRSRLKLDPLENLAERIKTLEATTSTAPLEEMVKDSQRIQQLQSDVKALLDQAAKNEASLMAMRERMEKAESERVSMGIVWALGALVLLCLAGMATLWNRRKESNDWQHSVRNEGNVRPAPTEPLQPSHKVPTETAPVPVTHVADHDSTILMPMLRNDFDVDVNLMDMDTDFSKLMTPAPAQHVPTQIANLQVTRFNETQFSHHDFNSDAIADVRQQAEFFEKLGKVDQAIEVLEQRIRLNSKDAPLLYLDLLRISNAHNLKTDFRQFRDEFEQHFNVNIPEFALFRDEGRSLESYPSLLQHISKLWPTDSALDVMSACVVRDPMEKNADPFDVSAFGDLVLLHGLAYKQLHSSEASVSGQTPENSEHIDIGM